VAAELLTSARDLLDARPFSRGIDEVLEARGWSAFLAGLDDATLGALEGGGVDGPWPRETPATLHTFVERVRVAVDVPGVREATPTRRPSRKESPRKHAQVVAFERFAARYAAGASRVLDVGAGHGHLTRALGALGLERDPARVATARRLGAATFEVRDVMAEGIPAEPGDCLVGLHACGALGDQMVGTAIAARAGVVLLGCCLQKRSGDRPALRRDLGDALDLPHDLLGLSNLVTRDAGVEASREANLAARARRVSLRLLLAARGLELRPGAETEGVNRRTAHGPLPALVAKAFAVRGLEPPPAVEIEAAEREGARAFARARRLGLPRSLLGRAIEVFVLHDRAAALAAAGFSVEVGTLFPLAVSARNLVLAGRP